jgi:hypothetical protein
VWTIELASLAWAEGEAMSLEGTVAYALGLAPPPTPRELLRAHTLLGSSKLCSLQIPGTPVLPRISCQELIQHCKKLPRCQL